MGYDYLCLVSLEGGEKLSWKKDIPRMGKLYKRLRKEDDYFPVIGKVTRGWYSTGDHEDKLIPSFVKFTSEFPEQLFRLHLSYFDHEGLSTWLIQGDKVVSQTSLGFDDAKVEQALTELFGFRVATFSFSIQTYHPCSNITAALNPKYGWDVDQEMFDE